MYMQHHNCLPSYGKNKSKPWRVGRTSCLGSTSTIRICETDNVKLVLLLPFVQCQDSTYNWTAPTDKQHQKSRNEFIFKQLICVSQDCFLRLKKWFYKRICPKISGCGSRLEMWSVHISRPFRSLSSLLLSSCEQECSVICIIHTFPKGRMELGAITYIHSLGRSDWVKEWRKRVRRCRWPLPLLPVPCIWGMLAQSLHCKSSIKGLISQA
jgi:hypothetical protein